MSCLTVRQAEVSNNLHSTLTSTNNNLKLLCLLRLHDVLHSDKKLTLVFEYCDQVRQSHLKRTISVFNRSLLRLICVSYQLQDLKKYFDSCNGDLDPETVKVRDKHAG